MEFRAAHLFQQRWKTVCFAKQQTLVTAWFALDGFRNFLQFGFSKQSTLVTEWSVLGGFQELLHFNNLIWFVNLKNLRILSGHVQSDAALQLFLPCSGTMNGSYAFGSRGGVRRVSFCLFGRKLTRPTLPWFEATSSPRFSLRDSNFVLGSNHAAVIYYAT